jgi:hypothetical protein
VGERRAGELLEVERVPAALPEQRLAQRAGHPVAEQLARLLGGERVEHDLGDAALARRGGQRRAQRRGRLPRPVGERDQHGRGRRAPQQVLDQLDRGVVRPMHVVQHQQQAGARARQPLQQRPNRAVRPVALGLQAAGLGRALGGCGEHPAELDQLAAREPLQPVTAETCGEVVQRVDPDAERELALELHAAAGEHQVPARLGLLDERGEQPRLADPGLACDREPTRTPEPQPCERGGERRPFAPTTDNPVANCLSDQCQRRT